MKVPRNIKRSVRSKNKWKKGESGKSNPEVRTHRNAIKGGESNFLAPAPPGGLKTLPLTVKALEKLNLANASLPKDNEAEIMSEAETFRSWATNMTHCSNPVFNRVLDPWAGNTVQQREVLAVLSGVTQTIQEKGGKESVTEYFAALILCLETVEDMETLSAAVYLLHLVVSQGVPEPVLRKAFGSAAKHLLSALDTFSQDAKQSVSIKFLLNCLGHILRAQDMEAWTYSSTHQVYKCLLHFITHEKPVIRKAAHQALCMVLKGSTLSCGDSGMVHPAGTMTQQFVCDILHTELGTASVADSSLKSALKQGSGSELSLNRVLYLLNFLGGALTVFPLKCVKVTCEEMLQLMRLPNLRVHCLVLSVINELFSSHPGVQTLTLDLTGQICTALFSHKPGVNEAETNSAWLSALLSGVLHLATFDDEHTDSMQVAELHLNKLLSEIIALLQSDNKAVRMAAIAIAKRILSEVLPDFLDRMSESILSTMFRTVASTLSYQFFEVWSQTLPLISAFIRVWSKSGVDSILPVLQQLADLRDANKVNLRDDIDRVFATAIEILGPESVLNAVPLNIEEELANKFVFRRSWLLPLVASHVRCTTANYFHTTLVPLADKVLSSIAPLKANEQRTEAAICEALYYQIWFTLPGFCIEPTDWEALKASDGLLFDMASRLDSDVTIRPCILAALKNLLMEANQEEGDNTSSDVMKLYAKILIPKLLTIFETSENDSDPVKTRQQVGNVLEVYFPIVNKKMLQAACTKALTKAMDTTKLVYFDMLTLMAAHLQSGVVKQAWSVLEPLLKSTDHHQQKKAYRFLEEICKSKNDGCQSFIEENRQSILTSLTEAKASSLKSPVKKTRLHCYLELLRNINTANVALLDYLLPEALHCLMDRNSKARVAAGSLLVEIVLAISRWRLPDDPFDKETLCESLSTVLERLWPLLEPVDLNNATTNQLTDVTALAVAYLFRSKTLAGVITRDHATQAIEAARRLVSCDSKSLAVKGLEMVRLMVRYCGRLIELDQLLQPLCRVNPDFQQSVRFYVKPIFNKLLPKYGLNVLRESLPKFYHKQLRNSHIKYSRTVKNTTASHENDDETEDNATTVFGSSHLHTKEIDEVLRDSSEDEDEDKDDASRARSQTNRVKNQQKKRTGKSVGWLEEAPGEVLDLTNAVEVSKRFHSGKLDASSAQVKPGAKRKLTTAFPMKGGKLLITDGADSGKDDEDSQSDDDDKGSENKEQIHQDSSDSDSPDAKRYRPGGIGIHRKTKPARQYNLGEMYRSQKASGDMKKPGCHAPFAYLPLNKMPRSQSSHRKLLKTVQKGAAKGRKAAAAAAKQGRKRKMKN